MRPAMLLALLLVRAIAPPSSDGLPSGGGTARATDLLRAKKMADEAAKRLEVRPPGGRTSHWVHGGAGWDGGPASGSSLGNPTHGR
jgi:hypothetical protein